MKSISYFKRHFGLCIIICFIQIIGYTQTINNNLLGQRNFNPRPPGGGISPDTLIYKTGEAQLFQGSQALKLNDQQYIYVTSSKRKFTKAHELGLDSLIIPDSTFFMVYGVNDMVTEWQLEKKLIAYPMLSFEISNMPPIGDTALFEFCIISNENRDNYQFEPEVYFSDQLERPGKKFLPKGFDQYLNQGKLPLIRKGSTLYHGRMKLVVTKDLEKKRWIHLRIPYTGDPSYAFAKGGIAPFSLIELNEKSPQINSGNSSTLTFDLFSSTLSNINTEKLKSCIKSNQGTSKVQISAGIADSGNKEHALFLAYLRMEAIRKKLVESGIPIEKIEVVPPQFKDEQSEELNRTIQVRFL